MSDTNYTDEEITQKVSRLPPLSLPLDPIIAELFEETRKRGGHLLNLHKTNAHAPRLSRAKKPLTYALRNECDVARIYRELAICRTAQIVGCDYEVNHHLPLLLMAGVSQAQADALPRWAENKELYDEKQLAVLAMTEEMMTQKGEISDATFSAMEKHFSAQEIVEILYNSTTYYGNGLFMKALRIVKDEPHKKAAPGKF